MGLNPFTAEDADRFFGREALTASLLDRLGRQRFLAVFGASGEGKSSLLRAGIAAKFPNAVVCTPGQDPDAAIAGALARAPELLVVDQFEELFTLCEDEVQRTAFLDALLTAPPPDRLRELRAVWSLEASGTPAARTALAALVKGDADARLTREATAAAKRMAAPR